MHSLDCCVQAGVICTSIRHSEFQNVSVGIDPAVVGAVGSFRSIFKGTVFYELGVEPGIHRIIDILSVC